MKKVFLILAVIFVCNISYAQYYDDEDDIYFYQCISWESKSGVKVANNPDHYARVFNFDGDKATSFTTGAASKNVKSNLASNINYYETEVWNATYNMRYDYAKSKEGWKVYKRTSSSPYSSSTVYFNFSADRKTLIEESGNSIIKYKLVDKSYFTENGRRRSNLEQEFIYE